MTYVSFRKGTFQGRSIARQIYHLDLSNLVQNCPTASSFRTVSHCLTILSYIVSRTLNVRKGYPCPPNPEFLAICCSLNVCRKHENWKATTNLNLKQNSYILIQENAFENVVCEMTTTLSQPQCVKKLIIDLDWYLVMFNAHTWRSRLFMHVMSHTLLWKLSLASI